MKKYQSFMYKNSGKKNVYDSTTINYFGYGYGKHYAGMMHLYGYDINGEEWECICTYHRAKVIKKLIKSGEYWNIHKDIRKNYETNGFTTRVGIRRANLQRCKKMADSHRKCSEQGKSAHDYRVRLRN
jgi:hypothetical protein